MLESIKHALGVEGDDFDERIIDLINAAKADMGITDINVEGLDNNPLFKQAVTTYCQINFHIFGIPEGYDKLKAAYDEQKAQMLMATGFTDWGDE